MTVALIDNGSLQPAAHRRLRVLAAELSARAGVPVHAVSWKHSDRIRPSAFAGPAPHPPAVPLQPDGRAWTLEPWVRAQYAAGECELVFVPFFISAQGAIGSALRDDLVALQRSLGKFDFRFAGGLATGDALVRIAAAQVRALVATRELTRPPVIVVDHGGPSAKSARVRDAVAARMAALLGGEVGPLAAASLEGAEYAHNRPLFADQLSAPGFDRGDVVVAPLFLAAGRHAGPRGDLAQIARAAEDRLQTPPLRCHFAGLIGAHPLVAETLADELRAVLAGRSREPASTDIAAAPPVLPVFPGDLAISPLSA